MTNLCLKALTEANWLEPDKVLEYFIHVSPNGQPIQITGNEWARRILEPALNEKVPGEVKQLFEVAQGAMIYGYFFYPLYTLAFEQVFRVAESAVSYKCKEIGAPRSEDKYWPFWNQIDWLINSSVIASADGEKWHDIRKFRNATSHPKEQMILMPANVIQIMEDMVRRINSLFAC